MAKGALTSLKREVPTSDSLPYSQHVTENIISTRSAEYMSVWRLTGRSHLGASFADVKRWVLELNNTLKGVSSPHIAFWSHTIRRLVAAPLEGDFENFFCRKLNDDYQASFSDKRLLINELYITIVYRPTGDKLTGALAKAERPNKKEKLDAQSNAIEILEEANRSLSASLSRRYGAELLGIRHENGYAFSEVGEFLAYIANGEPHKIPVTPFRLNETLPISRLFFSGFAGMGAFRGANLHKVFGLLELTEYVNSTEPGHFNSLLESDYEFILSQSFSCLSKHAAKGFLKRHVGQLEDSNDVGTTEIAEIYQALDDLQSGEFVMGEHHASLMILGDSSSFVRDKMGKAMSSLQDVGVFFKPVDRAIEAAFWAQFPCNFKWRPRPAPITSLNFLSFSSFHNYMAGKADGNPWGKAVTMLKTPSSTPLYFNFHATRPDIDAFNEKTLGHTTIIGKSGTGKTVLLNFLIAQAQRFKPTLVCFDKDRGMEVAIRAMNGRYLPLRTGIPTGFNPLVRDMTPEHEQFCRQWLRTLITSSGDSLVYQDEVEIDQALKGLEGIPQAQRSLTMFMQFLPSPRHAGGDARATVHDRLSKWAGSGEYAWVFDNPEDTLDVTTHQLYGFDVTEFLDHPSVREPLMMYLLYRTEAMATGQPFIYLIDEFWKPLQDKYFEKLAKDALKTGRKAEKLLAMASQEPDDALALPIAKTIVQQCATLILMPNPQATREDYIDGLKLTEAEFDIVRNLGEDSRQFAVKQAGNFTVAELDLAGLDDVLNVLSGTPENGRRAERLAAHHENSADWLPAFWDELSQEKADKREAS